MANGLAPDGAVLDQIDDMLGDGLSVASVRMSIGPSADESYACGGLIPARWHAAMPSVRTCVACQAACDHASAAAFFGIDRPGSQDSQLR